MSARHALNHQDSPVLQHTITPNQPYIVYDNVPSFEDPEFWHDVMRKNPEITHLRVAENTSACMQGGDKKIVDVWGDYLTDIRELVGCSRCLEWMHA